MTPEGRVKSKVRELLAKYQPNYTVWPVQAGYGRATLDCLGCYRGRFFGIETKAPGKEPTPRQAIDLAAIVASGGKTFVIDGDVGELKQWLDDLS
jgi:hypothetical protein